MHFSFQLAEGLIWVCSDVGAPKLLTNVAHASCGEDRAPNLCISMNWAAGEDAAEVSLLQEPEVIFFPDCSYIRLSGPFFLM